MASSRLLCRSYITKRSDRNVTFILMQAVNHTQLLLFSPSTIANAKESTNQWCLWLRLDFADLYLLYKWISFMLITILQLRNPSTNGSNDQHTLWNWFVLKEVSPSKRHRTTIPGFHDTMCLWQCSMTSSQLLNKLLLPFVSSTRPSYTSMGTIQSLEESWPTKHISRSTFQLSPVPIHNRYVHDV